MNVIMLAAAEPKSTCKCCGSSARTNVSFTGPDADPAAQVDLCDPCRRMLGFMLLDDSDQRPGTLRQVV